jgi:predicted small secreted protein
MLLPALLVLSLLQGCNTMRGFGKDVQQAGEGIQRAVR